MSSNKKSKKKSKKKNLSVEGLLLLLTNIVNAIGIPGAVIVFIMFCFMSYVKTASKEKIVTKIISGEFVCNNQYYFWLFIVFIILIVIIKWSYFKSKLKLKQDRIDELVQDRKNWQSRELGDNLSTSK